MYSVDALVVVVDALVAANIGASILSALKSFDAIPFVTLSVNVMASICSSNPSTCGL